MSKISELSDGGSLVSTDFLIAVRSGGNVKVKMDTINVDQVDLGDNEFIRLGNSQDLTIVHDASNSIINQAGIGDLLIQKAGSTKLTVNSTGIDVTGTATFTTTDNTAQVALVSTDADASDGPILEMFRNSSSPADDDDLGIIKFFGENDASEKIEYGIIEVKAVDVSDGTEDGSINITAMLNGTARSRLFSNSTETVFNEGSRDLDFRVESDNNSHALFVQGSDGSVGIGTSSPSTSLDVVRAGVQPLRLQSTSGTEVAINMVNTGGNVQLEAHSGNFTIDADGVGIGTSSPDSGYKLDVAGNVVFGDGGGFDMNVDGTRWQFSLGGSEKMRIDGGNLLVGKTSAGDYVTGVEIQPAGAILSYRTTNVASIFGRTNDGEITRFTSAGAIVGSIGTANSGDLYIGNDDTTLLFAGGSDAIIPRGTAGASRDAAIDLGSSPNNRFKDLHLSGVMAAGNGSATAPSVRGTDTNTGLFFPSGGITAISRNGVEAARFDASGNFLAGKSSSSFGTDGFQANADGQIWATNASASVTAFNRRTTDGDISVYYKDGSTVGSIGTNSDGDFCFTGSSNVGIGFQGNAFLPLNGSSVRSDNVKDVGAASVRFDDIYATNGTIQTSDRNEKQDIEELSDAEQRVAVAAKGLLRKFRWKSSVAENGDDARIHFGIIAQDLQAAFAAEGLDAGDYAMFINSTWTDEETGEERSRMGVRYSELLAFIIAAI